ncbi:MAG: hypothetical protein IKS93_04485 [Methanobrevibacter sp.]|nr:hypothetical protein [Methanobrevibacter sp.]
MKTRQPIYSFTIQELIDNRDGNFIHHDQHTKELESPVLEYAYANTLKFKIKSSHFGEKVKFKDGRTGTNQTWYNVYVLFEDFYCLGKDKDIDFEDAIDYAIDFGDIHIRCNCAAELYWGYRYLGTQMKYLYGIPRESRFPKVRNPNLKGTICKHEDAVLQFIQRNKELIAKMFAAYYDRLNDGQSIYAVNPQGTTITIGKKNDEGDVFFERIQEEEQELDEDFEELDELDELHDMEEQEEDNVIDEDGNHIATPDELWENPDEVEEL